jgi:hypothetical protein
MRINFQVVLIIVTSFQLSGQQYVFVATSYLHNLDAYGQTLFKNIVNNDEIDSEETLLNRFIEKSGIDESHC